MRCALTIAAVLLLWAALPAAESPPETPAPRVPSGCRAADATTAEPYSGTGWAKEIVHEKTAIVLVFIPAGKFEMGSPDSEKGRRKDEGPLHTVTITRPFYLGKYEVTQAQRLGLMGSNPSGFLADRHPLDRGSRKSPPPPEVTPDTYDQRPVERVSWEDCRGFLAKAGDGLRLPTEAQWEYACRAGTATPCAFGETLSTAQANHNGNLAQWEHATTGQGRRGTIPVGSLAANAWGLYDMHGNVIEWVSDRYGERYCAASPSDDPQGPSEGSYVAARGGSWNSYAQGCRSSQRWFYGPRERNFGIGLRVALDAK